MEIKYEDLFLYRLCPNLLGTKEYKMLPFSLFLRKLFFEKLSDATNERELLELMLQDKKILDIYGDEIISKIKRADNELLLKNIVATFFTLKNEIMTLNKKSNKLTYIHKNVEQIITVPGTSIIYKYQIPYFIAQANIPDIIPIFSIDVTDLMSYYEPISYYNGLHLSDRYYKIMTLRIILIDPCNKSIVIETLKNFIDEFKDKLYINTMFESALMNYYRDVRYLSSDYVLCKRCIVNCVKNKI